MANGGGGRGAGGAATPEGFSCFSPQWGELLFQTNFLFVGTSLGHMSMEKISDWTYRLCSKIRQREGTGTPLPLALSKIDLFF